MPQECRENVGRGIVSFPCYLEPKHDGPHVSRENVPSQHARRAWELATELETLEETNEVLAPEALPRQPRRQVPHPGVEPLSAFQGPARTSQTGLMEHVEEGISGPTPLSTIDTNDPGKGRTLYQRPAELRRPETPTIWADESVEVNPQFEVNAEDASQDVGFKAPLDRVPTKVREGDQPLPVVNDSTYIQDLVIADIEERKAVGIARYGTPLQAFNGRNVDQDLYEELIDAATYLRQKLVERVELEETLVALTRLLETTYADLPVDVWGYLDTLYLGLHTPDE